MSFISHLFKPKSAMPRYHSNVRPYLNDYEGKPVYNIVDLGLSEVAPVAEFSRYIALILPVQIAGESAAVSDGELKFLHKLEDRCIREAEAKGFLYAGRHIVTAAEHMYIAFYCREENKAETIENLMKICSACGREPTRVFSKEDRDWHFYLEILYPDIYHIQPINHQEILEDLKKHGDTGEKPRNVSFWMYFATKAEAERCLGEAASEGYTLENIDDMSDDKNFTGKKPFALTVRREMPLKLDDLNAEAWKLIDMAKKYDGDYDGIETEVIKGG